MSRFEFAIIYNMYKYMQFLGGVQIYALVVALFG